MSTYGRFFIFCCRMYFADFAIALIFYPVIKPLLFGCWHTQISNLSAKINFANMLNIVQKFNKSRVLPNFWNIYNIFAQLIFALKFSIWMCQHPNNMHNNCKISKNTSCSKKNVGIICCSGESSTNSSNYLPCCPIQIFTLLAIKIFYLAEVFLLIRTAVRGQRRTCHIWLKSVWNMYQWFFEGITEIIYKC